MEQLTLDLTPPSRKTTLLVDTIPPHLHKKNVLNFGLDIVAREMNADVCHWRDTIPNIEKYDTIGFSVIYVMYVLNIVPFLRRHNISPWRNEREKPRIIFGGQGVSNMNSIMSPIGETFKGEIGGELSKGEWHRVSTLTSDPLIGNDRSIVEISRGCKYRCRFCEYSHVTGGTYREKDISLIKDQLTECVTHSSKRITLRTANLAGHRDLDELLEHCVKYKIYQGWSDISVPDADRITKWLQPLDITAPKIGVESFDEATRKTICGSAKRFSDEYLEDVIMMLMENCNLIHLYLIYGLPGDSYKRWYSWVRKLKDMRDRFSHNIRIDFSITNFNPCPRTPMAHDDIVDFRQKEKFIENWISVMKETGFYKAHAKMGRGSDYGRHGRKELTYKLLMVLRHGESDLTHKVVDALPYGIGRSVSDKHALQFIDYQT